MKKKVKIVGAVLLCALMTSVLCSCKEYKEAQDDMAGELRGFMDEAGDLESEYNNAVSEFSEAVSGIQDQFGDISGLQSR